MQTTASTNTTIKTTTPASRPGSVLVDGLVPGSVLVDGLVPGSVDEPTSSAHFIYGLSYLVSAGFS